MVLQILNISSKHFFSPRFYKLPSDFFFMVNVYVLVDMRCCLYLKTTKAISVCNGLTDIKLSFNSFTAESPGRFQDASINAFQVKPIQ